MPYQHLHYYYMANPVLHKSLCSDWFFLGQDFAVYIFAFFKCKPPEVHFTIRNRVPYNKLLTKRACSGLTGEYWPSVVFVRTSLRSIRTVTTSGQYSPVRPSRSLSKRLVLGKIPKLPVSYFVLEFLNSFLL